MRRRPCQICGSEEVHALDLIRFVKIVGLDMTYSLGQCSHCGFDFAYALADSEQFKGYYTQASKYDFQVEISELESLRSRLALSFLMESGVDPTWRVLDIGCGPGVFLSTLRDAGFANIRGIDPAPKAAISGARYFNLDCISRGDINSLAALNRVECVSMLAVLEHLPDLKVDFSSLLNRVCKGTYILIEVPALDLFDGKDGEPFGELSIEHINFFSSKSLKNFLESVGCEVLNQKVVALPSLASGSLFMLAVWTGKQKKPSQLRSSNFMGQYLQDCAERWRQAAKLVPNEPFILYGAGSHSARLLAGLSSQARQLIVAVVDSNINLQGKSFGVWTVERPECLGSYPGIPVLISSYRARNAIGSFLKREYPENPTVAMYETN